jgi:UDP-2,3-diacylglucosamine pyrophosphatase LpxH
MTTAILSDLHLGAWQMNDLLRYRFFIQRLSSALEGVDEVVLLGDVLELRFQQLDEALRRSQPFFAALGSALRAHRGRFAPVPRVVYVAGNHDYHFALELLEREQERVLERALEHGDPSPYRFSGRVRSPSDTFLLRALRRMLGPGVEAEFAYAYVRRETDSGPLLAMHGHYLDLHLSSPGERLLALAQQAVTAYRLETLRPGFDLYDAVLRPQNELLHWIGQSPAGAQVQSELWRRLRGNRRELPHGVLGRARRSAARRGVQVAEALAGAAARQLARRVLQGDVANVSPARATDVDEGIRAFMDSLYALQSDLFNAEAWQHAPAYVVFGHTHRPGPLSEVDSPDRWRPQWAGRQVQVLNCGSWLYDAARALSDDYHRTRWPGTLVLVPDGQPPRVVALLQDLSADKVEELIDAES